MSSTKTKISLGAGTEIEEGDEWLNLDLIDLPGIDIVYNLVFLPYTFLEDNQLEYIRAKDILEHFPNFTPDWRPFIPAFMEEMYRVMKPGATLWVQTPGHRAAFAWSDPTHTRVFTPDSMAFFDPDSDFGRASGYVSTARFHVDTVELENGNLQFTMVKI